MQVVSVYALSKNLEWEPDWAQGPGQYHALPIGPAGTITP
jgi:hypothetical protein